MTSGARVREGQRTTDGFGGPVNLVGLGAAGTRARVTDLNKTTDSVTSYDPWSRACLDDAVGELECQGRRVVAEREGVGADGQWMEGEIDR